MKNDEITKIIPHRAPFLFIDEIIELNPGVNAVGIKKVKPEEEYFKGHFVGNPVMPGVLIIESMAQVGAIIVLSLEENKGKVAYFSGIKDAKFLKVVLPGDELVVHCELIRMKFSIGYGYAKAYVNNTPVCEATLSFFIGENKGRE